MQRYTLLIVALGALAVMLAWAGPTAKSVPVVSWEYRQLTTLNQTLLRPTVDGSGNFDEKANSKVVESIAYVNGLYGKQFQADLAKAGREGWELVSVTSAPNEQDNVLTTHSTAYLKRPKR